MIRKIPNLIIGLVFLAICFAPTIGFLSGCASVTTDQTETSKDGTVRHTRVTARTLFDSQSTLAKARASSSDKSQTLSLDGLSVESASSNVVGLVGEITGAAVGAAVKAAK